MELIVMLLVPFPVGLLVRNRPAAFVTYVAVHGFVFTAQTLNLLVEWVGGSTEAFGAYPDASDTELLAYLVVNAVIFAAGLGLVWLGSRLGARRRARAAAPVALDS
ncbi:hypothetical protein KZZ52_34680 [Dactylosporangium sp. AC04546]|uniref:hypothetical protein n=1 Tax=Dactylosporangium sp. AC04546 TaxID=2862460 RepID=UPI001EDFC77C|nr:hypothetical protein [Dactylosporangium sp. AC04546]WVK79117.1 hypothetical protein KZZ52_34680 [Dactylosporangium sp. AC04546]